MLMTLFTDQLFLKNVLIYTLYENMLNFSKTQKYNPSKYVTLVQQGLLLLN